MRYRLFKFMAKDSLNLFREWPIALQAITEPTFFKGFEQG